MSNLPALLALSALTPIAAVPVIIRGRQILVDGKPLFLKGVNWNPVPKGGQQGHGGVHFRGFVETDSELMAAAGINAVRTYEAIADSEVLDVLWQKGIHVLNTVYISGDSTLGSVVKLVNSLKDHPAILMWVIGNEWNYNMLYSRMTFQSALNRVHNVARLIKQLDRTHPIATVYGMMPAPDQLRALDEVDVWGLTAYTGITFGNLFDVWVSRSEKPMFLAEFGADAYNAKTKEVDEVDQARATVALTREIIGHRVERGGVCIGGFIFELTDEWWKDGKGSPSVHDAGGVAPGGGPFPDNTFNEEYWGVVGIDGTPRQAYRAYAEIAVPGKSAYPDYSSRIAVSDITAGYRMKACGANPACVGILGDCCPGKDNEFHSCCGSASKKLPRESQALDTAQKREHSSPLAPLAPWTPSAHSQKMASAPPSHCEVGEAVACCPQGNCGSCAGDQCCPSTRGSVTCPSASKALGGGCIHPKLYDCTGETGIEAPRSSTTTLAASSSGHTSRGHEHGGPQPDLSVAPDSGHRPTKPPSHGRQATRFRPLTTLVGPTTPEPQRKSTSAKGHTERFDVHLPDMVATIHSAVHHRQPPSLAPRTTTTEMAISVHTTMQPIFRSQQPGAWVLGPEKASCNAVCVGAGGCVEGSWPESQEEFMRVVAGLGYACFDLQEGGGKYDPSTQQGNCGWRWIHKRRETLGSFQTSRCAAVAPAFTRRFCPCQSLPGGKMAGRPRRDPDVVMEKFSTGRQMLEEEAARQGAAANIFA